MNRYIQRVTLLLSLIWMPSVILTAQTAQMFIPLRVSADSFPKLRAHVVALDAAGLPLPIGANDVTVTDNGTPQLASTSCSPSTSGRNVSLVVAIDASLSMTTGPAPTSMDLAKNAARGITQLLTSTADEAALVQVGPQARMLYGLSTNRTGYTASVDAMTSVGGMNLGRGLTDIPYGAITHLQNARNARSLLLITDGASSFDVQSAISTARTFGISVYVVCLKSKITPQLKMLADSTKGAWCEMITTVAEAQAFARGYVAEAKGLPTCSVSWTSSNACDLQHKIELTRGSLTRTVDVLVDKPRTVYLESNVSGIEFGSIPTGSKLVRSVTYTATNSAIEITSARTTTPVFAISNPPRFPLTLQPGQSLTLAVEYAPTTDQSVYGKLEIASSLCSPPAIHLHGGNAKSGDMLRLLQPNGGETLVAGRDTVVSWTNALPDDFVRIEISYDNGTTWSSISENAQGLSYVWRPGPKTSDKARVRISRTVIDQNDIVVMKGQDQPVYASLFTEDGKHVLTGGHDGSVRIWSVQDGSQERIVGLHGNWVWSLAQKPGTSLVASASHDGSVRVWDYMNGQRIATIPAEGRVWAVAFSSDGKKLYAGSDRGIAEINTDTWTIFTSKVVDQGPVYNIKISQDGAKMAVAEGPQATLRATKSLEVEQSFRQGSSVDHQYAVALNPSATQIASGGADLKVHIYKTSDGSTINSLPPMRGGVLALDYVPNGSSLLVAGGDGTAKTYNSTDLSLQTSLAGHNGILYSGSFSPDGKRVVTSSTDFTARVWSLERIGAVVDQSDSPFTIIGGLRESTTHFMGDVVVGSATDARKIVVSTKDAAPLVINSVRFGSGDTTDFAVLDADVPFTVTQNSPLSMDISFTPTASGSREAYLTFESGMGPFSVVVTGNGLIQTLSAPQVVDFGRRVANQSVVDSIITIRANGSLTSPLQIASMTVVGEQAGQYSIVDGGGSVTIQPGQSHRITVRFDPTNYGRFAASIELRVSGGQTVNIGLYGEATGDGRIAASTNTLLFPTGTCRYLTTQIPVDLRNSGNTDLQVFSIGIDGIHANEFTVQTSDSYPITIPPNGMKSFIVTFSPTRVGVKDARVVVSSSALNASNGKTIINVSARKDSVGFELSRATMDFGNVPENTTVSERILLLNTGTISLKWPRNSITVGRFQIDSITPDITAGGKRSDMTIRFLGGRAGESYDTTYEFVDTICGRKQTIRLMATVKSYIGATIEVDSVATQTGTLVSVPVYVKKLVNFDRTTVRSITAHYRVNSTLLSPTGNVSNVQRDNDEWLTFSAPIPIPGSPGLATTLTFNTAWGNDTASSIIIDSLSFSDTLTFRTIDGRVVFTDLCKQGGDARRIRLGTQSVGISVGPNPAGNHTDVHIALSEPGLSSARLYTSMGEHISTIFSSGMTPGLWHFNLDTSSLPAGSYFIVLTTPTESVTKKVEVVR